MQIRKLGYLMVVAGVALAMAALPVYGQQKCGGAEIANGPFQYAVVTGQAISYTFVGAGGSTTTVFTVTAPGGGTVFPAESPGGICSNEAPADIKVFSIGKVVDGSIVDIPLSSDLGQQIAAAFDLSPDSHTFGIGEGIPVNVTVTDPDVSVDDYGSYLVKMKAQTIGSGVGVGSGFQFALNLQPPASCVDNVSPVVSILKPTLADKILGHIVVRVQASDPTSPATCASGLASLTAKVSSAEGTVSDLDIPLTLSATLPVAAGTWVTGDGLFTPTGGTGSAGTTSVTAFTSTSRSGIGSYTITFTAQDVAGNTALATVTFEVKYAVAFTKAQASGGPNPCNPLHPNSCKGQYQFTVKRAPVIGNPDNYSDGAFMYDQTVEADLVRTLDNFVAVTHDYGTSDPKDWVKIDSGAPDYETNFEHLGEASLTEYKLKIYFQDVDDIRRLQATSAALSF